MGLNIDVIAETVLWENVSNYVEQVNQLYKILANVSYIDKSISGVITRCEVLDSEELCVLSTQAMKGEVEVMFEMPFILTCWNEREQLLRITALVSGRCMIPDESNFDYSVVNFSGMNRQELLEFGKVIEFQEVEYFDVEVEDTSI